MYTVGDPSYTSDKCCTASCPNPPLKEGNVLFNDALKTFYLQLYGIRHMVKDHSDSEKGNPLPHIGYSLQLTGNVLLYAPSHRQDSTYHSLCYTSCGALAGTRNSSMGPPFRIDPTIHEQTPLPRSYISLPTHP